MKLKSMAKNTTNEYIKANNLDKKEIYKKLMPIFANIDSYYTPEAIADREKVIALSRKFSSDYNRSILKTMTMDQYAIGHGDHENFCYRIERELAEMGNITGMSRSRKFGVWYDKNAGCYKNTQKFGDSPGEAWENVRSEILSLLDAGERQDYKVIQESKISPLFKYKLLAVYYPDVYITIYSDGHLSYFCNRLDIRLDSSDNTLMLQRKLILWKEQHEETRKMSLLMYVKWLYRELGQPPKTEWVSNEKKKLTLLRKDLEEFDRKYPEAKTVEALRMQRSAKVSAYVKARANGICQLCGKPAPFLNKQDEPYLECHHVIWLKRGGADEADNAVALCPNCHKKMHILDLENDVKYLQKQR